MTNPKLGRVSERAVLVQVMRDEGLTFAEMAVVLKVTSSSLTTTASRRGVRATRKQRAVLSSAGRTEAAEVLQRRHAEPKDVLEQFDDWSGVVQDE